MFEENNNYENHEFLGDRVLDMSVAFYICRKYPDRDQGFKTVLKTKLVRKSSLAKFAKYLDFPKHLIISKQVEENTNSGRINDRILEDVMEAFICGLFLDQNDTPVYSDVLHNLGNQRLIGPGWQIANAFIENIIENVIDFEVLLLKEENYKEQLLQYYQKEFKITPEYISRFQWRGHPITEFSQKGFWIKMAGSLRAVSGRKNRSCPATRFIMCSKIFWSISIKLLYTIYNIMYSTIVDPVSLKHYNIASMKGVNILQKFLSFGHGGALPEVTMVEKRPSPDGTGNFSHKDFFTFYGGNSEWNSVGGAAPPAATTDETVSVAQETVAKLSIDQDKLDEWQCKCAAGGKCVCESNFEIDSACLIYAKSAAEHKSINNILTQELAQARNTIRVWEAQYDAMRKDRDTWKKSEISGEEAIKEQGAKITKQAARIADDEKLELAQSAKIAEQAVPD